MKDNNIEEKKSDMNITLKDKNKSEKAEEKKKEDSHNEKINNFDNKISNKNENTQKNKNEDLNNDVSKTRKNDKRSEISDLNNQQTSGLKEKDLNSLKENNILQDKNKNNKNEKDNKNLNEKGSIFFTSIEDDNIINKNKADKGLDENENNNKGNTAQKGNFKMDINKIENDDMNRPKNDGNISKKDKIKRENTISNRKQLDNSSSSDQTLDLEISKNLDNSELERNLIKLNDSKGDSSIIDSEFAPYIRKLQSLNKELKYQVTRNNKLKNNLNTLMEELNKEVQISDNLLNSQEILPRNEIHLLDQNVQYREKELNSQKLTLNMYLQYYESFSNKSNDKYTHQKIGELEQKISLMKVENEDLVKRIKALKSKQNLHSRELETYNQDKLYPKNINILTEEIKNLVGKKHDYFQKLNQNKRALENLRIYYSKTKDYFEYMKLNIKDKISSKDIELSKAMITISDDLIIIESELDGTDEEILNKINRNILFVNEQLGIKKNNKIMQRKKSPLPSDKSDIKKPRKLKEYSVEESLQKEREFKSKNLLPEIKSKYHSIKMENKSNSIKKDIGVFNKYEYLAKRDGSPSYLNKQNKSLTVKKDHNKLQSPRENRSSYTDNTQKNRINKIEEIAMTDDEEDKIMEVELEYDYETTNNYNFEVLKKREKQLEKINRRVLQNIQENDQIYSKKLGDMEFTLEHNQTKLRALIKENELLSTEIQDLNKIINLSKEENKILNEIKDSKIKQILDTNISQTRNEILQELNVLKSEDSFINQAGHEILQSLNKNSNSTSLNNSENSVNVQDKDEKLNEEDSNMEDELNQKYIELTAVKTNDIVI